MKEKNQKILKNEFLKKLKKKIEKFVLENLKQK